MSHPPTAIRAERSGFVGRRPELETLRGLLDRAVAGEGQVALIEGEAGIGKTRLLAEALGPAEARGVEVLRGSADELERDRPFWLIAGAIGLEPASADARKAEIAGLLVSRPHGSAKDAAAVGDLGFRITDAVVGLVEELASRAPLAIALEDLHWADVSTLRVVRALGRRIGQLPVALIATLRPSPRFQELDRVIEGLQGAGAVHLALEPLDAEAVAALATEVAGVPPAHGLLEQLGGAGGNPFYVIELMRALEEEGAIEIDTGLADARVGVVPPGLRLTLLRRLSFLPEATLEDLRIAAVLGSAFSPSDLATVTGRSSLELLPVLRPAIDAGLVGEMGERLAFRHDLIREAIYTDLPEAVRKGIHRDVGQALAEGGAPVAQVAEQLALGARPGDVEAVRWLREAAQEAGGRSPTTALRLLDRALALADGLVDEQEAILAERLEPLVWTGQADKAEAVARELLASELPEPQLSGIRNALAGALASRGEMAEAVEQLELAATSGELAERERASFGAAAAHMRFFLADVEAARLGSERAAADGKRLGNDHALSVGVQTLSLIAAAEGFSETALELAERAVAVARRAHHPQGLWGAFLHPFAWLAMLLLDSDRPAEAEQALQAGARFAEEAGGALYLPFSQALLAECRFLAGEWDDALAEVEATLLLADEVGTWAGIGLACGVRARIAVHRGDLPAAKASIAEAEPAVPDGYPVSRAWLAWGSALVREAEGDVTGAVEVLSGVWATLAPIRYFIAYRALGPDLVRLALASGDRKRALAVTAEMEEGARRSGVPTAKGAALRCRGLVEGDPEILDRSVTAYRSGFRVLDLASACEDAGVALGRTGRLDEGRALLEEALETYDGVGATRDLARANAALRAMGVRRRRSRRQRASTGWESLTESELRVAKLAAEGLTNRQIGERLFVSRRTVETHLKHIFQKLDLSTRTQLAGEAARHLG